MVQRPYMRLIIIIIMSLTISFPIGASAEEVGNFTRVEKKVDYMKGGTGPATPAAVKKSVEVSDLIQTHDLSRAQVEFRDKSTIIIAPMSKVTIEDYMFDPAKFERNAKVDLIMGVSKVVVPVLLKTEGKSKFLIKTSTATIGIRGTEFIVISGTNFSLVYAIKGRISIRSESKGLGKDKASQGSPGSPSDPGEIFLDPGTMSVILAGQFPSTPQAVSPGVQALAEGLVLTGFRDIPGTCVLGTLPGVNLESLANDLMSQGATLESVKESLTAVYYPGAETYEYAPPGPSAVSSEIGPTFPGGSGGTTGEGVESPAQ